MVDEGFSLIYSKSALVCFFIFIIILQIYYRKKKRIRIRRWQNSLNLREHSYVFQHLYQHVDGFRLSLLARKKQDAIEYVYGEIEFFSFIALLSLVRPDHKTVFYDLGSGIGKAVLACAMVYPIHKCVGIEFLPELYKSACEQTRQLIKIQNYTESAKKIKFIQGDFLEVDLQEATLVFINSTTIIGSIWENLCARLEELTQLNAIITTSKPLLSSNFLVEKSTKVQMSWGVVTAYIHVRKTNCH